MTKYALGAAINAESAAHEAAVNALNLADRLDGSPYAELAASVVEEAVIAHLAAKAVVDALTG